MNTDKSTSAAQKAIDNIIATLDTASFTYESIPLGLLLTNNKEYFRVPQGMESDISFIYYRNMAGSPLPVATLAGGETISGLKNKYKIYGIWLEEMHSSVTC